MACVNKIASEPLLRADDNMSITFSRAHNNLEQSVIIDRDKEELKEGTEEPDQTVPVEQNLVD